METNKERKLKEEFQKKIEQIFDVSKDEFRIIRRNPLNINQETSKKFFIFSSRVGSEIFDVWEISNNEVKFYLCIISYETTISIRGVYSSNNYTGKHQYFYGFINTNKDFGTSLIKPETIQDKISEFFHRVEIDFKEHSVFSKRYYCISKDIEKFKSAMSYDLMNYISSLKYIEIEFNEGNCLFRLKHSVANQEDAFKFLFIGIELSKLLK